MGALLTVAASFRRAMSPTRREKDQQQQPRPPAGGQSQWWGWQSRQGVVKAEPTGGLRPALTPPTAQLVGRPEQALVGVPNRAGEV